MKQDDALALGAHLAHDALVDGGRFSGLEVAAVDVDGEGGDLPGLEVAEREGGVPEIGEAEEGRERLAQRLLHGAEAQLDLVLRLVLATGSAGWRATRCGWRPCGPGRATSLTVSGSVSAIRPTMKKVALVHWAASVSRIGRV